MATQTYQQVRIVTADPTTSRLEGVDRTGTVIQIAVWESPLVFRWPVEGETWRIRYQGHQWYLDNLVIDPASVTDNSELQSGTAKISADKVVDREDREFIAIESDDTSDGQFVVRSGDEWITAPVAPGSGDLHVTWDQNAPANPWIVTHILNKYPSVTVVDSTGEEVKGSIHYDSLAQITLTFSGAFSGKAYLN